MFCLSCMHWLRPVSVRDSYGNVRQGTCRLDGRLTHRQYCCADHEDFASTEGRLGLTKLEVAWIRTNREYDKDAQALIKAYNLVLSVPDDRGARGLFQSLLSDWRRDRPTRVLEPFRKKGAATGNPAGATEESTHAPYQHSG